MLTFDDAVIVNGEYRVTADLSVDGGTRNAVIGPSGAGKSTLLLAVAGFLPLEAGRILWGGTDLAGKAPAERPVSIVFQDQNLFPHLTALQNVALGLSPSLRLDSGQVAEAEAALARVGLDGMGGRKPRALSGGQQSRLGLARVVLRRRPVLLLDEPFAALGPALRAEMLDLVGELAAETGATLLMVTHEPADARRIAKRTIVVTDGRAEAPRPTGTLLDDPPAALRSYLGSA
jgi:thiamine transport system ATP-binding protein